VTYKGAPVKGGSIAFYSEGKLCGVTPISGDGSYKLNDIIPGEMVVTVETESVNPNVKKSVYGGSKAKGDEKFQKRNQEYMRIKGEAASEGPPAQYRPIPKKYADLKKSDLRATIVSGRQSKDFELTD